VRNAQVIDVQGILDGDVTGNYQQLRRSTEAMSESDGDVELPTEPEDHAGGTEAEQ
jgi:hypothetical protein